MAAYTSTTGDVEAGGEERTVVLVERSSSCGWMWKVLGALLVVALCLGGVLLLAWYWNDRMTDQLHNTEARVSNDASEKTHPHSMLRQISTKSKAAIHLEGHYEEGEDSKLEWKENQGQAFAQDGFRLEKNQIVVPHTGLYFVYSQASFGVSCKGGDDDNGEERRFTPLSHRIWRLSDSLGSPTSLMSAVRSACQNVVQDNSWYSAIYLGAVFKLNEGDLLWTETNQLSELETDDGRTFFGVFAL